MDIFASYSSTEDTKRLHDLLESQCEFDIAIVDLNPKTPCRPAPPHLDVNRLRSDAGRVDRPDGSINIYVVTQAGKPAPDFDASVPSISYVLSLITDERHLDEDLKVFRAMLGTIKIAP